MKARSCGGCAAAPCTAALRCAAAGQRSIKQLHMGLFERLDTRSRHPASPWERCSRSWQFARPWLPAPRGRGC